MTSSLFSVLKKFAPIGLPDKSELNSSYLSNLQEADSS